MHRLSHVTIRNFRSCQNIGLALDNCTPIIGYNNAGKSNLLDAVAWLMTGTSLGTSDFKNTEASVVMEGTVAGLEQAQLARLDNRHQRQIDPYVQDGELRLRRVQNEPGMKKSDIIIEVRDPQQPEDSDAAWRPNPAGIDNALKTLFPEPITIGAMEDATEDATKAKNTSTIGKLLAQFVGSAEETHGAELEEALSPIKDRLAADGTKRANELTRFDEAATEALHSFFPGIRLHLDIPVPTIRELFGKGTIKVSEQGRDIIRDFTALGHGAQRSIQMALIRYLAEVRAGQGDATQRRLLLIEEPELFLHPQAIETVRSALESLSENGYQVVFSTHSPMLVACQAAARTRIIRKAPDTGETHVMRTAHEALERRVRDENRRLYALFELQNASHWLFSDGVLIAEGPTERNLLPPIYEAATGRSPVDDSLAILGLGGTGAIPDSLAVLEELGIRAHALADLDFAANDAVKHNLIDEDDAHLQQCLQQIESMATTDRTICIGTNGRPYRNKEIPNNKKPAEVYREWAAREEARPVATALHRKLLAHNIWLWTGGDIEHHLGLSGPKDVTTWAPFCERLRKEPWADLIHDAETVQAFIDWLVNRRADS